MNQLVMVVLCRAVLVGQVEVQLQMKKRTTLVGSNQETETLLDEGGKMGLDLFSYYPIIFVLVCVKNMF